MIGLSPHSVAWIRRKSKAYISAPREHRTRMYLSSLGARKVRELWLATPCSPSRPRQSITPFKHHATHTSIAHTLEHCVRAFLRFRFASCSFRPPLRRPPLSSRMRIGHAITPLLRQPSFSPRNEATSSPLPSILSGLTRCPSTAQLLAAKTCCHVVWPLSSRRAIPSTTIARSFLLTLPFSRLRPGARAQIARHGL